jgi:alginate O-acetyltransferase complex protein AlgJ
MKKFILKTIFFLLPLSFIFVETLLPLNIFTYRPWEALIYKSKRGLAFPFYPNQSLVMNSVGDLCHHSKKEIIKYENWTTDKLGYRNDTFIKKANVLLIGDSFITGCSLSQDSTITSQLQKKEKCLVYNMAPANFNEFIALINHQIIDKPNLIVFGIVERSVPTPLSSINIEYYVSNVNRISILKDRISRLYLINYLNSRISKQKGNGIKGKASEMYFLSGKDQYYHYDKINEIAETIVQYKNYCDSIGVNFIFLPLPNKETVYYENVPFDDQPNFILKLDSILNKKGVITINTQKIFNAERDNNLLYHLDDTHWNSNGVNIVVNELIEKARTHNILYK